MLTKDKVNNTIKMLPDSFTIDEMSMISQSQIEMTINFMRIPCDHKKNKSLTHELIEQLIFMEKVEEGYQQSEACKVISNEDVKLMIDNKGLPCSQTFKKG